MAEKLDWQSPTELGKVNIDLKRRFEILDRAIRLTGGATVTIDGVLTLGSHQTLVLADTTAGGISLTLPPAASVDGYRLEAKVTAGVYPLELVAAGTETIDGQPDVETYTRVTLVSKGGNWVEL